MNKIKINIPSGIRYLSQWPELWNHLPAAHVILNKQLTGIGATHMFLTDPTHKVILCSPRVALLESKRKKHLDIWFYRGSMMDNGTVDNEKSPKRKKASFEDVKQFNADCAEYISSCSANSITPHIMSTYDSLGHVIDVLRSISPNEINDWTLVIDEFQVMFSDAAYKATTELTFLNNAKFFKQAIFLSATPYLESYMQQLSEFDTMDYYTLEWPDNMQEKATVHNITLSPRQSIPATCKKIIDCMRAGKPVRFGTKEIDTTECVFYINKVSTIVSVINKCKLKSSEVNILCAKSDVNDKRLKEIGHSRGGFPQQGDKHKMFTFCTRTSFLGVDFWSTCAYSYVFADPSQKTLALDISTDLSQILGRQRLEANPYQHEAILFLKENSVGKDDVEFCGYIEMKRNTTDMLIKNYNAASPELQKVLLKKYRKAVEHEHYSDDYLCVRDDKATGKAVLEFNKLVMLSEIRAWEIRKKNYQGQYSVICQQHQAGIVGLTGSASTNPDVISFKAAFEATRSTQERIRLYAEFMRDHADLADEIDFISHKKYREFWDAFGYEGLKALGFQESKIKTTLSLPPIRDGIVSDVILELRGILQLKKYTYSEVKDILKNVYKKVGYQKVAVATDIGKYLTWKKYQASDGKRYIEITSLYQKHITIFPFVYKINTPLTEGITVDRLLDIIETGEYKVSKSKTCSRNLKDIISDIRHKILVKEQKKMKAEWLPVACVNGVFKNKHDHSLQIYSSFVALDYDNFTSIEAMEKAKEELKRHSFVYALYTTPSGLGIKAIVIHDSTNPEHHRALYKQIEDVCALPQTDTSVSDLSRGHFLSHDPHLWRNPKPEPFHFKLDSSVVKDCVKADTIEITTENTVGVQLDSWESLFMHSLWETILTDDAILERLDKHWHEKKAGYFDVGNRHRGMLIISGTLCQAGVVKQKTTDYLQKIYPEKESKEIMSVVEYAYDSNPFGCQRRAYK